VLGVSGAVLVDGVIQHGELNPQLNDRVSKYRIYSDILANNSVTAAGTRLFLNLVSKSDWIFTPSDTDVDGKFARLTEEMLTIDPSTPWHRIVRRASMYRFYGFSVQEWVVKRRGDGVITFSDIMPRPQSSIAKWDVDRNGVVQGVFQEDPNNYNLLNIPRYRLLYMNDDALNDTPEGLGLFRHLVEPSYRLKLYEQLEGKGFESNLAGVPVARIPLAYLQEAVKDGTLPKERYEEILKPFKKFMKYQTRYDGKGIIVDSQTYMSADGTNVSNVDMWDMALMQGASTGLENMAAAIKRINYNMAMVLNVDQLLLGNSGGGSLALARDKTNSFVLMVDSILKEIIESVKKDLVNIIWGLNGFDPDMQPTIKVEPIQQVDVEQASVVMRNLALSALDDNDPITDEFREKIGYSSRPEDLINTQQKDIDSGLV
jgi:hypothetical protein